MGGHATVCCACGDVHMNVCAEYWSVFAAYCVAWGHTNARDRANPRHPSCCTSKKVYSVSVVRVFAMRATSSRACAHPSVSCHSTTSDARSPRDNVVPPSS
jgi:hypothetical protein